MNQLLLSPTDILFFRDGRPMGGSLAGHGAAWPLPTVTNAALHAALWRSGLAAESHAHGRDRPDATNRAERFGSLTTAGPFPVCTNGTASTWFIPRPLDADCEVITDSANKQTGEGTTKPLLAPAGALPGSTSSNPLPLAVASLVPPSKTSPMPWWSEGAWNFYLRTAPRDKQAACLFTKTDSDFSDQEANIGIGIDPARGTQDGERLYSAHYLRLHDGWHLGLFAETAEKFAETEKHGSRRDLIPELINQSQQLLVGGQQRLCTATCAKAGARLPLPLGQATGFATAALPTFDATQPRHLVKWVLLTPAIFPDLPSATPPHPGGWLPSWIHPTGHTLQLRAPLAQRDVAQESRDAYRARIQKQSTIRARLVAALIGKPLPVTGWSLGTPDNPEAEIRGSGAKSTHLAVPAGSVYYFACDSATDAAQLAAALNWHGGDTTGTTIRNRRSTLLGEKGFGLGVCGTWTPHTT
jgi:hypothetical protein